MADDDPITLPAAELSDDAAAPVAEQIIEPRATRIQFGPPEQFPYLFTFTGEDCLELTTWCSVAGVTVNLTGRVRLPDGLVQVFGTTLTTLATRLAKTDVYTIPKGDLLNVVVDIASGSPLPGQVLARVNVRRGLGAAFKRIGTLIRGPVSTNAPRAWPGSPIESSLETEPAVRQILGTTPAAGVNFAETVPTGARWELLALLHSFATDATVTDRRVTLGFLIGGIGIASMLAFNVQGPTLDWVYTWGPAIEGTTSPTDGRLQAGTPGRMILPALATFGSSTINLQAGDQFSNPRFLVREWLEGA